MSIKCNKSFNRSAICTLINKTLKWNEDKINTKEGTKPQNRRAIKMQIYKM